MVVTKDRPLGPGRSVLMFIVVECEDHSAIQAPQGALNSYIMLNLVYYIGLNTGFSLYLF